MLKLRAHNRRSGGDGGRGKEPWPPSLALCRGAPTTGCVEIADLLGPATKERGLATGDGVVAVQHAVVNKVAPDVGIPELTGENGVAPPGDGLVAFALLPENAEVEVVVLEIVGV